MPSQEFRSVVEMLRANSRCFAERAQGAGVEVELESWDEMFHDWHCYAVLMPEAREAIARIGEFLRQKLIC
jgi:acetyl esterase/lipase